MSETLTPIAEISPDERPLTLHGVQPGLRPRLFARVDDQGEMTLDWLAIRMGAAEGNHMARMLLAAKKDGGKAGRQQVRSMCSVMTRAMVGLQAASWETACSLLGDRALPTRLATLAQEVRKTRDAGAALLAEDDTCG